MRIFLIIVLIQLLSVMSITSKRHHRHHDPEFAHCPKFPTYFAMLMSIMSNTPIDPSSLIVNNSFLETTVCVLKLMDIFNEVDNSMDFGKMCLLSRENTIRDIGIPTEEQLYASRHCFDLKGATKTETFKMVDNCVQEDIASVYEWA
ncbi:uncharacterized protein LOC130675380 [Microplitis mediator]|uniref:uncharacterized protein LOC130675380 n=1 Tax=Microplitis mediator TaxID=375433 RepID=UPI002553D3C8|nr:uncharacterized protein LOC130675380 [Microplitis mediator]